MANALMSLQIIPKANGESVIPYIDEAIHMISLTGLKYNVQPLETTVEGELDFLLAMLVKINERMTEMGCENVISQVKLFYQPSGITMQQLTEKYH